MLEKKLNFETVLKGLFRNCFEIQKIAKLKKGEGRTYEVRLNLGDNCVMPPRYIKHWRFAVDERGAYWTRLIKERNRIDVAQKMTRWFQENKCRARIRHSKSIFHSLMIRLLISLKTFSMIMKVVQLLQLKK